MPSEASSSAEPRPAAETFEDHCRETNEKRVRVVIFITLGMQLVAGPVEYFLLQSRPDAAGWQALWMLLITSISVIGAGLFFRFKAVRDRSELLVASFFAFAMAIAAAGVAQIGGLETMYVGIAYVVPFIATMLLLPIWRRVWIASLPPVTFLTVLFTLRPDALDHPYAGIPIFHSFLAVLFTTIFGHLSYMLAREHFEQRVQLAGEASRLDAAVRDRTREVFELARNVVSIEEGERTRIARELHDELGQRLTAVRLEASATASAARQQLGSDAAVTKRVTGIEAGVALAQRTVREVVHSLRPPELDELGLSDALDLLIDRYRRSGTATIDYENELAGTALSDTQATTVYRVLQEALTNVTRHSQADEARVRVRPSGAWIEMVIADDGIGIETAEANDGFGLRGMRERLRLVDGEFSLAPGNERGTVVRARFPRTQRRDSSPEPAS